MKKAKILGLVRHILTFGGGYFVAQGSLDENTAAELTAAVFALIGAVWSVVAPEKKDA